MTQQAAAAGADPTAISSALNGTRWASGEAGHRGDAEQRRAGRLKHAREARQQPAPGQGDEGAGGADSRAARR